MATKEGAVIGMRIRIWITLQNVLDEFRGVFQQILASIGEVLGTDPILSNTPDPRFCIGIGSSRGWEPLVVNLW
jgi:hypothetical protein